MSLFAGLVSDPGRAGSSKCSLSVHVESSFTWWQLGFFDIQAEPPWESRLISCDIVPAPGLKHSLGRENFASYALVSNAMFVGIKLPNSMQTAQAGRGETKLPNCNDSRVWDVSRYHCWCSIRNQMLATGTVPISELEPEAFDADKP